MKKILLLYGVSGMVLALAFGCSDSKKSKLFLPAGEQSSSVYTAEGKVTTSNLPCGVNKGTSSGDPHFCTFDGYYYSNQLIGEFVLARVPGTGGFEVQVRQARLKGANPAVTWNTAVALRLGGHVIEYRADANAILVDGTAIALADNKEYKLDDGGVIRRNGGIVCRNAAGTVQIWVRDIGAYANVSITAKGEFEGLLGNYDGSSTNDLRLRNGSQGSTVTAFVEDWRVKTAESLFTYEPGLNTNSYTENQDATLDIGASEIEVARQACIAKFGETTCTDAVIVAIATDFAAGAAEKDVLDWYGDIMAYNDIVNAFSSDGAMTYSLGLVPPFTGSDQTPAGVPESDLDMGSGSTDSTQELGGQVIVLTGASATPEGVIPAEDDGQSGPEGDACNYKGKSLVRHGKDACKVTGTWYRDANTIFTYQAGKAMAGFKFNNLDSGVYEVTVKAREWNRHADPGTLPSGFTAYRIAVGASGATADVTVAASATGFNRGKGQIDLAGGDTMIYVNWYNGFCNGNDCANFQLHSIKLKKVKESKKLALASSIYNIYKKNQKTMYGIYIALGMVLTALLALTAVKAVRRKRATVKIKA